MRAQRALLLPALVLAFWGGPGPTPSTSEEAPESVPKITSVLHLPRPYAISPAIVYADQLGTQWDAASIPDRSLTHGIQLEIDFGEKLTGSFPVSGQPKRHCRDAKQCARLVRMGQAAWGTGDVVHTLQGVARVMEDDGTLHESVSPPQTFTELDPMGLHGFATSERVCISRDADFTGCPFDGKTNGARVTSSAGWCQLVQASLAGAGQFGGPKRLILFDGNDKGWATRQSDCPLRRTWRAPSRYPLQVGTFPDTAVTEVSVNLGVPASFQSAVMIGPHSYIIDHSFKVELPAGQQNNWDGASLTDAAGKEPGPEMDSGIINTTFRSFSGPLGVDDDGSGRFRLDVSRFAWIGGGHDVDGLLQSVGIANGGGAYLKVGGHFYLQDLILDREGQREWNLRVASGDHVDVSHSRFLNTGPTKETVKWHCVQGKTCRHGAARYNHFVSEIGGVNGTLLALRPENGLPEAQFQLNEDFVSTCNVFECDNRHCAPTAHSVSSRNNRISNNVFVGRHAGHELRLLRLGNQSDHDPVVPDFGEGGSQQLSGVSTWGNLVVALDTGRSADLASFTDCAAGACGEAINNLAVARSEAHPSTGATLLKGESALSGADPTSLFASPGAATPRIADFRPKPSLAATGVFHAKGFWDCGGDLRSATSPPGPWK